MKIMSRDFTTREKIMLLVLTLTFWQPDIMQ